MEGMKEKNKVEELKSIALNELELMQEEYEQIVENNKKQPKNSRFKIDFFDESVTKELYLKRKDRKYAALTVELYALLEQLLKDINTVYYPESNYRNITGENIITDLEQKIDSFIKVKNNTKLLAVLRNRIVHHSFSLKQARKNDKVRSICRNDMPIKDKYKNKELFAALLKSVEQYIDGIKVK